MRKREISREDENNARRDSCNLHVFKKVYHKIDRWKCHYCGYECCGAYVKGYEQGLEHNSIEEVINYEKK